MRAYFKFVLRHRMLVVITCLVITALAGWSMSRATMSSSLGELVLGDHPAYHRYVERVKQFGSDEHLIVAFEEPNLSSPEVLGALQEVVLRLQAMDEIARVDSVLGAMQLQNAVGGAMPSGFETLASNPLARDVVISADGRHLAVIIQLTPDKQRAMERTPAMVREIIAVFEEEGFDPARLHLGGLPAVLAEVMTQTVKTFVILLPVVAIMLLVTTLVLFRRIWPVFVTLLIGILAIVWTMGFAIALDRQINIILAICPALILIIAFSDVVHLCSAYLLELAAGKPRDEAILDTASEVGTACLFTSLTTMLGFMCLSLIDVPVFRMVGVVLGFGVAIALLLAMTLVPILFSVMRPPKSWSASLRAGSQYRVGSLLDVAFRLSTTRPWLIIACFAIVCGVSIYGVTRIEVETDITGRFSPGNKLRRDTAYFRAHFAGTNVVDVLVELKDGAQVDYPDLQDALERVHEAMEALPGVGRVLSLVTVLRAVPAELLTGSTARSAAAAGFARQQFSRYAGPGQMRYVLLLHETGMHRIYEIGQQAESVASEILGDDVNVEASGFMFLAGMWIEENVRSQRYAIMISFAVIAVVMMLLFRSISVGLGSMLPNAVPLLLLGGALGLLWRVVDSDMAVLVLIAIGIAVDDTIHFLARYRVERPRSESVKQAIERTFSTAGRAIVMTSLIFAAGFAPLAFSDYLTIRLMGLLLPLIMIAALVADLLLLPALITVGAIRLSR